MSASQEDQARPLADLRKEEHAVDSNVLFGINAMRIEGASVPLPDKLKSAVHAMAGSLCRSLSCTLAAGASNEQQTVGYQTIIIQLTTARTCNRWSKPI